MKKIVFAAIAAFACLATPAMAMKPKVVPPTQAQQEELAREAVVPAAELQAVIDRWNTITTVRNHSTPASEFEATVALSARTSPFVSAAQAARINRNRADFDKQARAANAGMDQMCAVLSGC